MPLSTWLDSEVEVRMALDSGLSLTGRTAIVTGGAQGIGYAVAQKLASRGAAVAIFDVKDKEAQTVAEAISDTFGVPATAFAVDICDESALERACVAVEHAHGPIRLLAHCAALTIKPVSAEELGLNEWDRIISVNLTGAFSTCRIVARHMIVNGGGAIVTISSTLGISVQGGRAAYAASKWGVIGLSKTMAVDWAPHSIRVNIVVPQATETAMMRQNLSPMIDDIILPRTPLKRLGKPHDVANAVAFLLSDESDYTTGSVLQVDGGISTGFYTG